MIDHVLPIGQDGVWDIRVESVEPDTSEDALPGTFAIRIRVQGNRQDDQVIDITGVRFTSLQIDRRDVDLQVMAWATRDDVIRRPMDGRLDFNVGSYTIQTIPGTAKGGRDGG